MQKWSAQRVLKMWQQGKFNERPVNAGPRPFAEPHPLRYAIVYFTRKRRDVCIKWGRYMPEQFMAFDRWAAGVWPTIAGWVLFDQNGPVASVRYSPVVGGALTYLSPPAAYQRYFPAVIDPTRLLVSRGDLQRTFTKKFKGRTCWHDANKFPLRLLPQIKTHLGVTA